MTRCKKNYALNVKLKTYNQRQIIRDVYYLVDQNKTSNFNDLFVVKYHR